MVIDDFVWLPEIVDKLLVKHDVSQDEAEAVFFDKPKFRFVEDGNRANEDVYAALGQTDAGRFLVVFFISKGSNTALVISARDMDGKERRQYGRK